MSVNNLHKTVTRQRRDCDLNPGPSAPEFSTLTTRLPSHPSLPTVCCYNASILTTMTQIPLFFAIKYEHTDQSSGTAFLPTSLHNSEVPLNCFCPELKAFHFCRAYLRDCLRLAREHEVFELN